MPGLLDQPLEILSQILSYLELQEIFNACSTCRSLRQAFKPSTLLAICENFAHPDQLTTAIDDASYLLRCHALLDAFRQDSAAGIAALTQRGASLSGIQCGKLLKQRIRECELWQVDTLLENGASLDEIPDGVNRLLEEVVRCEDGDEELTEQLEFLLAHGVRLQDVPSGYESLVDDLVVEKDWNRLAAVLAQAQSLEYVPPFLEESMREMFLQRTDREWLPFLLYYVPAGVDRIIDALILNNAETPGSQDVTLFFRTVAAELDALFDSDERRGRWSKAIRDAIDSDADLTALDEHGHPLLVNVAGNGYPGYVKLLLSLGAPINQATTSTQKMTPLYSAALQGHANVVEVLLEAGADTSIPNNLGSTPLHVAAYRKRLAITKALIDHGANVNAQNDDGWTALFQAAYEGATESVQLLIDAGADLTIGSTNTPDSWTALYAVTSKGDCEILEMLIEAGSDPSAPTPKGWYPLLAAAVEGHLACIELLHAHGVDLHATTCDGAGAAHLAAGSGHLDILKWLKDHGVDVLVPTTGGTTAMHRAAASGSIETVTWLTQSGLSLDVQDLNGTKPLMTAIHAGHEQLVRFLVGCGVDIHEPNNHDVTPLMLAAKQGHASIARFLIEQNANVNQSSASRVSPLHMTTSQNDLDVAKVLLVNHANVDAADSGGVTPLMLATVEGRPEMVRLFLDHGANIDIMATVITMTALHAAIAEEQLEVAALLIERGASLAIPGQSGKLPMHYAAEAKDPAMLRLLLEHHSEIDPHSEDGSTPLHYAALGGRSEAVELLLKYHAQPSAQNDNGFTPLYYAAWSGHLEVVELLSSQSGLHDIFHRTPLQRAITTGHTKVVKMLATHADSTIDGYGRTVYEWALHQDQPLPSSRDTMKQPVPRKNYLSQSVKQLARRLLETNTRNTLIGFDELGRCLIYLGLHSDATFCFQQLVKGVTDGVMTHDAVCSACEEDIKGTRYICMECPEVDFCDQCVKSPLRDEKRAICKAHQCLEITQPPPTLGDEIPTDVKDWLTELLGRENGVLGKELPVHMEEGS